MLVDEDVKDEVEDVKDEVEDGEFLLGRWCSGSGTGTSAGRTLGEEHFGSLQLPGHLKQANWRSFCKSEASSSGFSSTMRPLRWALGRFTEFVFAQTSKAHLVVRRQPAAFALKVGLNLRTVGVSVLASTLCS